MMKMLVFCLVLALAFEVQAFPSIDAIASESEEAVSVPFGTDQADVLVEDDDEPLVFSTDFETQYSSDEDHETTDDWTEDLTDEFKVLPKPQGKGCRRMCRDKCIKDIHFKAPVLTNLCRKTCSRKCSLAHMERLYKCTLNCARAMPPAFKSDEKKARGYVNNCYDKCIKKKN